MATPLPQGYTFSTLPELIQVQLIALDNDVLDGIHTPKSYDIRRRRILDQISVSAVNDSSSRSQTQKEPLKRSSSLQMNLRQESISHSTSSPSLISDSQPRQSTTSDLSSTDMPSARAPLNPILLLPPTLNASQGLDFSSNTLPTAILDYSTSGVLNTPSTNRRFGDQPAYTQQKLEEKLSNSNNNISSDNLLRVGEDAFTSGMPKHHSLALDYNQDGKRLSNMVQKAQRRISSQVMLEQQSPSSLNTDFQLTRNDKHPARPTSSFLKGMSYSESALQNEGKSKALDTANNLNLPIQPMDSLSGNQQHPTIPRELEFTVQDELSNNLLTAYPTLCSLLHQRVQSIPKANAFTVLDNKGKEIYSCIWDSVKSKAERVALALHASERVHRGDKIALFFYKDELIDFVLSLFGVWFAGMVPLPIVTCSLSMDDDLSELLYTLDSSRTLLILTTDNNLKMLQRELATRKRSWPEEIEWWTTSDILVHNQLPKRSDTVPQEVTANDVAYIDYNKTREGKLRGVSITHSGMMNQLLMLKGSFSMASRDVFLSTCEPRQGLGLVLSVLSAVYNGYHCINVPPTIMELPGLWLTLLTKYQVTLSSINHHCIQSYLTNVLRDPEAFTSFTRKTTIDLMPLRVMFIDAPIISPALHKDFADALTPFRPKPPIMSFVLTPIMCLPEFSGLIVSYRDQLPDTRLHVYENNVADVLLDRLSLRTGNVVLIDGDTRQEVSGCLRAMASGLAVPGARIAIVNSDRPKTLVPASTVGEIYFSSPALHGAGFFGQPKNSEATFHARPLIVEKDQTMRSTAESYLRTGYFGCLIDGNVLVVLGHRSERVKQTVVVNDQQTELKTTQSGPLTKQTPLIVHHYAQDLSHTIKSCIQGIESCVLFTFIINKCILPIVVLEVLRRVDELPAVCSSTMQVLEEFHDLPCFAVALVPPDRLPRIRAHGVINVDAVQNAFEIGTLNPLWIEINTTRMILEPYILPELENSQVRQITSGVELSAESRDDGSKVDLTKFKCISDVLIYRAEKQPDDTSFIAVDSKGREVKTLSWKKLSNKISALASTLSKKGLRQGDHVAIIFSHSIDYLVAVHACIYSGIIAIPLPPPDINRLIEDVIAIVDLCQVFDVRALLVNTVVEESRSPLLIQTDILRSKSFQQLLKTIKPDQPGIPSQRLPSIHNTTKFPKSTKQMGNDGLRLNEKYMMDRDMPAILWVYYNTDMERTVAKISHQKLMEQCRVVRQSCQLDSSRYLTGCVRTYNGIGFLYAIALGIYTGAPTVYLSPYDFSTNPQVWFETMHKFKVKDTFVTYPMLQYAMSSMDSPETKGDSLQNLQNLIIGIDDRPQLKAYLTVISTFASSQLPEMSAAAMMSTPGSPYITSRSYISSKLLVLNISLHSLRRRKIEVVDSNTQKQAIGSTVVALHDSGQPPAGTTVAIVDPDTRRLCSLGELGEIWIASPMNADGFAESEDPHASNQASATTGTGDRTNNASNNIGIGLSKVERFAQIPGDYRFVYARTREYGFLHPSSISYDPRQTKQDLVLFHVGSMTDSFQLNGYLHFTIDIEATVKRLHSMIITDGCVAVSIDGKLVLALEVEEDANMLNLVPLITMAVMAEHNLIVDTIAFLQEGMLARSRLFEKQRKKIATAFQNGRLPTLHIHKNKSW